MNQPEIIRARADRGCAKPSEARGAFTLVELLTVVAIIAVLATLFMTAATSAKKKSRAAVSAFNLRQISLALNMYLDDYEKRPPGMDEVIGGKYLSERRVLLCPEDKTGDWGGLTSLSLTWENRSVLSPPASELPATSRVPYSYLLHPLNWTDSDWESLIRQGSSAGLAACQLHGLGKQNLSAPSLRDFEGLLLRGQRDGAVVRRRIFWGQAGRSLSDPTGAVAFTQDAGTASFGDSSDLWPIYVDAPLSQ